MKSDQQARLSDLCYESKKGRRLNVHEQNFCSKMREKYPVEYKEIQERSARLAMMEVNPLRT